MMERQSLLSNQRSKSLNEAVQLCEQYFDRDMFEGMVRVYFLINKTDLICYAFDIIKIFADVRYCPYTSYPETLRPISQLLLEN